MQDGDEWVINGHKWFSSGANRAAFTTVMLVTEPDAPTYDKFSMIIVPTDTPGFNIDSRRSGDGRDRGRALRDSL